jgi:hypothetical protein
MKFKDFLDEEIENFRELKIGLVKKKNQDAEKIVRKVQENFDLGTDLIDLIEELNENLGNTYSGKFKFDYVLQDFQKIDKLKINKNRKEKIKEQWFKKSSELAKSQTVFERKLVGE